MSDSLFPAAATVASNVVSVLLRRPRAIGVIIPDVILQEVEMDSLEITDHPVESSAPITDHSYKKPRQVIMRCGWSNSASVRLFGFAIPGVSQGLVGGVSSLLAGRFNIGPRGYIDDVYEQLLTLQSSREPFTLVTGKRRHQNMLIEEIAVTTEVDSEHALMIIARMREVILVNTTTTSVPAQADQASPQQTAAVQPRGQVAPVPAFLPGEI